MQKKVLKQIITVHFFFKMGVINSDPKFKDAANRNYDLLEESPCIDTGEPADEYNEADGSRSNMGAR